MHRLNRSARSHLVPAACLLLLASAFLLGASDSARCQAGGKKKVNSADRVKTTVTAAKPDASGQQVITLKLAIEKGWHLYANPVGNEDFEANRTNGTVKSNGKTVPAKVTYPRGKSRTDSIGTYNVYEGEAIIRAVVNRGDNVSEPLQINIQVSACNESVCLPPGVITVKVQ